jgi:hypothetical protein
MKSYKSLLNSSLNTMCLNVLLRFLFYVPISVSQETDFNYASHKSLMKSSMIGIMKLKFKRFNIFLKVCFTL